MRKNCSLLLLLCLTIIWFHPAAPLHGGQVVTNFAAFNDHRMPPGPGPGTGPNTTTYSLRVGPGGPLKDQSSGDTLTAQLEVVATGGDGPDDFGGCTDPNAGTPAFDLFNGIVDVGGADDPGIVGLRDSEGNVVTLIFTNLDPNAMYLFRGTSVRGNNYNDRWATYFIEGATAYTDAHVDASPNNNLFTQADAPPGATLVPGQVVLQSGENRVGSLVGWDAIRPGPDGGFSISQRHYIGVAPFGNPAAGPYGYAMNAIMLSELIEPMPPQIVGQPPASTSVEQGRSFTLTVTAVGAPLNFQWHKDGTPIPGATRRTFTVAMADPGLDSGDYRLGVFNSLGSQTSAVAQVTVYADTNAPNLVSATVSPTFDPGTLLASQNQVVLDFSEPMLTNSAFLDSANYEVSDGVNVFGVSLVTPVNDNRGVVLALADPLADDADYTVTVDSALSDPYGNGIGMRTGMFHSWVPSPGNGIVYEAYLLEDPGTINVITVLTSSPNFPNNPDLRTNLWTFDSRVVYPTDGRDHYGARIRGLFIPPVTGSWRFYLRSDDPGQVFLNPSGPGAAGKVKILDETGCCGDWNKFESAAFPMQAGQGYYIEMLYKEGTGGDYGKVAARLNGTGGPTVGVANAAIDTNAITGPAIGYPLAPRDIGGALNLSGPADVTVEENHPVTLTVLASNPSDLPMSYQWKRGGFDIPGANGPSYSFIAAASDTLSTFRVQVAKLGSLALSREATLTVVADTNPPVFIVAHATTTPNIVVVSFSEIMAQNPDTANFAIDDGTTYTVQSAVVDASGTNIVLTLDQPLALGSVHTITIEFVQDVTGNGNASTTRPLRAFVYSRGFAWQQLYFGIGAGVAVGDLTGNAKYPNGHDAASYVNVLEGPRDISDNYGVRISGWLLAPWTGDYLFYHCSDDGGAFLISPDDSAGNLGWIAQETTWNAPRMWTGDRAGGTRGSPPANISTNPVPLMAGQQYAFESLAKEGGGGDNLAVAWQVPDGPVPANGSAPIPGAYLVTLADPEGASVTITQQPASVVGVIGAVSFTVGAQATYLESPYSNLSYLWQRDNGSGFQDILGGYDRIYTFNATLADNGARFRCLVFSPGASAISATATYLTELRVTITRNGNEADLAWPALDGVVLQYSTNLTPPQIWCDEVIPPTRSGGLDRLTYTLTGPMKFFRVATDQRLGPIAGGEFCTAFPGQCSADVVTNTWTYRGGGPGEGGCPTADLVVLGPFGVAREVGYTLKNIGTCDAIATFILMGGGPALVVIPAGGTVRGSFANVRSVSLHCTDTPMGAAFCQVVCTWVHAR